MKLSVLEKKHASRGVTVMELTDVELPLEKIITMELVSLLSLQIPGIHWTGKFNQDNQNGAGKLSPISYFDETGRRHDLDKGLIFFGAFSELIDFIAEKINFHGRGPLSELARRATGIGGKPSKQALENEINGTDYGPRYWRRAFKKTGLPIEQQSPHETGDYTLINAGEKEVWAWTISHGATDSALLAKQDHRELDGHRVPFYKLIKPLQGIYSHDNPTPMDFMVYDGRECTWSGSLEEIPLDIICEMDDQGGLYHKCEFDIMPMPQFSPVCLLRIPGREEMEELVKEAGNCIKKDRPPDCRLESPGLVFDSHYPLPLPDDLTVVDDPRAALWLLSRTVRGIYTPGKTPGLFPVKKVPERESYQILTRPRRFCS